jgi:hypothetical protein
LSITSVTLGTGQTPIAAWIESVPLRCDRRDPGHFVGFLAPNWAVDWALSPVGH